MMISTNPSPKRKLLSCACIAGMFLLVTGCSTSGKPIAEMAAAKTTLMAAEGGETQKYAPVALDRAKEKLKRAESAIARQEFDEARRLAEEAQADAELAQAVSSSSVAQNAVKELEDSIKVLREEILRARSK